MEESDLDILRKIPQPKAGERTCAICLQPVAREDYEEHLLGEHGYTTINVTPVAVPRGGRI